MNKMIDFFNGTIAVRVDDAKQFEKFKAKLKQYDMLDEFIRRPEDNKISYWRHIAEINNNGRWLRPNSPLYFEYQVGKGFSFHWLYKPVADWYGPENIISINQI